MKIKLVLSGAIMLLAIVFTGCSSMNLPSKTSTVSYPTSLKTPDVIEVSISVAREVGLPSPRNIDKERGTVEFGMFGMHDMSLSGQLRVVAAGKLEYTLERGLVFSSVDEISNKFKAELEKRLSPSASPTGDSTAAAK